MYKIKVGIGFDAHRFKTGSANSFIMLCGIKVPCKYSIIAHSDGDLALHALTDAMLGTIGSGDIGKHFPPSDPKWKNADSKIFIEHAHNLIKQKNGTINNVDIIIIGQEPRITPHHENLCQSLAAILNLSIEDVSVKATTTEKMGFTGREEGIACQALITVSFE
jgi:2-C-methyl-D-erythritol 4-phosphate cytidylyltransferase/2-C-methyl-D-erythritol 2,4-cyclodiphosphate synthase